jgi:ribosomal protein S27AE
MAIVRKSDPRLAQFERRCPVCSNLVTRRSRTKRFVCSACGWTNGWVRLEDLKRETVNV